MEYLIYSSPEICLFNGEIKPSTVFGNKIIKLSLLKKYINLSGYTHHSLCELTQK